eukprot:scaffold76926_cov40-Prasinocladus_malaysianus.AAC.2
MGTLPALPSSSCQESWPPGRRPRAPSASRAIRPRRAPGCRSRPGSKRTRRREASALPRQARGTMPRAGQRSRPRPWQHR